jgi:plastocyanin
LLAGAAALDLLVMLVVGVAVRDRSTLAFCAALLVGLALLRLRGGPAGALILLVLSVDVAVFMLPAAVSNATHREDVLDFLIPASLAAISLTAAVTATAAVVRRRRVDVSRRDAPPSGTGRIVAQAALAVFALAIGAGLVERSQADRIVARPTDLIVDMRGTSYLQKSLEARAGRVAVFVANKDLFWHTFTIDALRVDLGVPTRGDRRITFDAPPGTYEFYCRVPGHTFAGMKGTLTVR